MKTQNTEHPLDTTHSSLGGDTRIHRQLSFLLGRHKVALWRVLALVLGVLVVFAFAGEARADCKWYEICKSPIGDVNVGGVINADCDLFNGECKDLGIDIDCDPVHGTCEDLEKLDVTLLSLNKWKELAYYAYRNHILSRQTQYDNRPEHVYIQKGSFFYNCLARVHDAETINQARLWWSSSLPMRGGVTFGSDVYLSQTYKEDLEHAALLAHELTHIVQYNRFGNSKDFAHVYMDGIGIGTLQAIASGNISSIDGIHDSIGVEQEALAVGKSFESTIKNLAFTNSTNETISVAVMYQQCGRWIVKGWWSLKPGDTNDSYIVETDNPNVYYYASGSNGTQWGGKVQTLVRNAPFTVEHGKPLEDGYPVNFAALQLNGTSTEWVHTITPEQGVRPPPAATHYAISLQNDCEVRIQTAIRYLNEQGEWTTDGWFVLDPGEPGYVADTTNGIFYYYGESSDPDWEQVFWRGDAQYYRIGESSETYGFRSVDISNRAFGKYTHFLSCDPLTPQAASAPPASEPPPQAPPPAASNSSDPNNGQSPQGNSRARFWIECDADGEARIHVHTDPLPWPYPSDSNQQAGVWISSGGNGLGEGPMSASDIQPKYVAPHKKGVDSVDYRITVRFPDGHEEVQSLYYRWPNGCNPTQPQPPSQSSLGNPPPTEPPSQPPAVNPAQSPNQSESAKPPPPAPTAPPTNVGSCQADVCVTDIVVSDAPKRKYDVTFTATFVNNTAGERNYDWLILLYDPNKAGLNKGFGESPHNRITVPAGVSTQSVTFKAVSGPGPCINLYARAGIHQSATEKQLFAGSDGQPFSRYFDVC